MIDGSTVSLFYIRDAPYYASQQTVQAVSPIREHNFDMDSPKRPCEVIEFSPPKDTVARIEAFVGRLLEGNDLLASALVRLRDLYLAGASPMVADRVLAQVETALERAARARNGF
jgi:hypothetical protein